MSSLFMFYASCFTRSPVPPLTSAVISRHAHLGTQPVRPDLWQGAALRVAAEAELPAARRLPRRAHAVPAARLRDHPRELRPARALGAGAAAGATGAALLPVLLDVLRLRDGPHRAGSDLDRHQRGA